MYLVAEVTNSRGEGDGGGCGGVVGGVVGGGIVVLSPP